MIRLLYKPESGPVRSLQTSEIQPILEQAQGVLWLDFTKDMLAVGEPILQDLFKFHRLAIDDALNENHLPRVDDWGDYIYLVLRAFSHNSYHMAEDNDQLQLPELDIFVGHHYVVTYHEQPITAVDRVWALCQRDERLLNNGPDHLLYRLIDEIINDAIQTVEQFQDALNEIEDQIFLHPNPQITKDIFRLKRNILFLRRIISPQRDLLNKLARDSYAVIDPRDRIFFRDSYDHFIHLYEQIDTLHDLATGALETYLSVLNNNMNSVMKTLAVFTTLFLPLTFITGFFGMNFFTTTIKTDIWSGWFSFDLAIASMLLLPIAMLYWMHRRHWL